MRPGNNRAGLWLAMVTRTVIIRAPIVHIPLNDDAAPPHEGDCVLRPAPAVIGSRSCRRLLPSKPMTQKLMLSACAIAVCTLAGQVHAQAQAQAQNETQAQATTADGGAEKIVVTAKRAQRVSKGATGLPMEIKDTPQSISTIDKQDIEDFGATGSNEALRLGTGINIEQYETNRAGFNSRGFDIQLTQVDGVGMSNDWGVVVGQQDSYLFERIELIRGANGLLTGVGNASGTINYVRKRPKNEDGGEANVTWGPYGSNRLALDYNKVLTEDGSWAGRLVVAREDKDSYLRGLQDLRSTVYGVIDGQIGEHGMLTFGFSHQRANQDSPMWGSLTLNYASGGQAEFDRSSSTSQDWTYWNTRSNNAFVEYRHELAPDWELKATVNHRETTEDTKLFYAYLPTGVAGLNDNDSGLIGWPYKSHGTTKNNLVDLNLSGEFEAFGRRHSLIAGLSRSRQQSDTATQGYDTATYGDQPLPAFPYRGDVYPEPEWTGVASTTDGEQTLTRLYAASRLALTERLKAIVGVNAIKLQREGASRYGNAGTNGVSYPDTKETSPYVGLTYDITPAVLGYVSYSTIFQNQDQTDYDNVYLDPMKGVNTEAGVKAEWLDRKLLTTFAVFTAEQKGLATYAGIRTDTNTSWYKPEDVKSRGFEAEATGRIGADSRITLGFTRLKLTGPDGNDTSLWVPRTTLNFRFDTRVAQLPQLRLGVGGRWQSDVSNSAETVRQGSYLLANAFAAYELYERTTLRLNVDNLTDKKYIGGLSGGGIYGAPRQVSMSVNYKL